MYTCAADIAANKARCLIRHLINTFRSARNEFRGSGHFRYTACEGRHLAGHPTARYEHSTKLRYFCSSICGIRDDTVTCRYCHLSGTTGECDDITIGTGTYKCSAKFRSFHCAFRGSRNTLISRDKPGHIGSTNSRVDFRLTSQFRNKSGTSLGNLHTALSRCGNDMFAAGYGRHLPCSSDAVSRNLIGHKLRHKAGSSLRYFHTVNGNTFTVDRANGMRNVTCIATEFRRCHIRSSCSNNSSAQNLAFCIRNMDLFADVGRISGRHNTQLATIELLTNHTGNRILAPSFRHMYASRNHSFGHTGNFMHLIAREGCNTLRHCLATRNDTFADRRTACIGLNTGYLCTSGYDPFRLHIFGSTRYDVRLIPRKLSNVLRSAFCTRNNILTCRRTGSIRLYSRHLSTRTRFPGSGIESIRIDTGSCLSIHTSKDGCIIEGTTAFAACHLIPLTAIRCSNNTVGSIRLFKLRSTVHIHICFLTVRCGCCGTDPATGNLSPLHLEPLHMRHVVTQRPICNVTGNGTGSTGRTGCNRRNGLTVQSGAVSGCDSTKGPSNKSCTTAEAHAGTTFNNSITNIGIGTESGSKSCSKTSCCRSGSGCSRTSARTAKDTACGSGTAANTGNNPGCHQQFHTHTGSGLSHIQAHGSQIAVKSLSALQICQGAEHPEEDTSLSCGQSAAVAYELAHGGSKASQEPNIHNQEQQLRTNHSAPGLEHIVGTLGCAHGKSQGRSITENTNYDISFHCLKE